MSSFTPTIGDNKGHYSTLIHTPSQKELDTSQEAQTQKLATIPCIQECFSQVTEQASLASLPVELLTLITDNLSNDTLLRFAPLTKKFSEATLSSCKKREGTLFAKYTEKLIETLQKEKKVADPIKTKPIEDISSSLTLWKEQVIDEIAGATHLSRINTMIAQARTHLAKILAKDKMAHIAKKLYITPKPSCFSTMGRLIEAYQMVADLPQQERQEQAETIEPLFKEFVHLEETEEALLLAKKLSTYTSKFDSSTFPILLHQCFEKGMGYQALCFANSITHPNLKNALINLISQILKTSPLQATQLTHILQGQLAEKLPPEKFIQQAFLLTQVYMLQGRPTATLSALLQLDNKSNTSQEVQETFIKYPELHLRRNDLLFTIMQQYLNIKDFTHALTCARMTSIHGKIKVCDHLFSHLIQNDKIDLASSLIDQYPEALKNQQITLLIDHQLTLGRIDDTLLLINPHLGEQWAKTKCLEITHRLMDEENWKEVILFIELLQDVSIQIACLEPICDKLSLEKKFSVFLELIEITKPSKLRNLVLKHTLMLAIENQEYSHVSHLHASIHDPIIQDACQAYFAEQLARHGEIEKALQEAEKIISPPFQLPVFFTLMNSILVSPTLTRESSLEKILTIATRASFEEILKALPIRKRTEKYPIDISRKDILLFLEKLETTITFIRSNIGNTSSVQKGTELLKQAKQVQT